MTPEFYKIDHVPPVNEVEVLYYPVIARASISVSKRDATCGYPLDRRVCFLNDLKILRCPILLKALDNRINIFFQSLRSLLILLAGLIDAGTYRHLRRTEIEFRASRCEDNPILGKGFPAFPAAWDGYAKLEVLVLVHRLSARRLRLQRGCQNTAACQYTCELFHALT